MKKETLEFLRNYENRKSEVNRILNSVDQYEKRQKINVSGIYRMRVRTFVGKKNGEIFSSPNIYVSANKGYLCLSVQMETVDDTDAVPQGSIIYHTITLLPPKEADEDTLARTIRMMKPSISALTGLKKFELTEDFIRDYLTIDYDDDLKILRNHKMTQEVMCVIEPREYQGKIDYKIVSVSPAGPNDRSRPSVVEPAEVPEKLKNNNSAIIVDSNTKAEKLIGQTLDVPDDIDLSPDPKNMEDY